MDFLVPLILIVVLVCMCSFQLWMITRLLERDTPTLNVTTEQLLQTLYAHATVVRTGIPSVGDPAELTVVFRLGDIEVDPNSDLTYDTFKAAAIAQLNQTSKG